MAANVFKLLAISGVAFLLLSLPTQTTALSVVESRGHSIARHALHHDAMLRKKRSLSKRCRAQHSSASAASTKSHSSTKKATSTKTSAHATATKKAHADVITSKKVGLAWANGGDEALKYYKTDNTKYLYSWSPDKPSVAEKYGFNFVPMFWGVKQADSFKKKVVEGYADHVLSHNEPNEPSQSNVSPQQAAKEFTKFIAPLRNKGYTIISPATTNAPSGIKWMKDFFDELKDEGGVDSVDAVAMHWYATDPQDFIDYVKKMHDTFGKPVWVTEFACQNFADGKYGAQPNMDHVWNFFTTVTTWMEQTSYVHAYFAFGVMHDMQGVNEHNQLMADNGKPTALGQYYLNP